MNKPATDQAWSSAPRWYLWDGGFLAIGRSEGIVPPHSHHAIQVTIAIDGDLGIRGAGDDWRRTQGFIVRADVEHSFDGDGINGAMLFVDPESVEGAWLNATLRDDITLIPAARLSACVPELRTFYERPLEAKAVDELIRHCVISLCAGAPPSRRLDERIMKVLQTVRGADDLRMSLEHAASLAFLSPSRFAHLFKEQVGLPFRRYMLWRKLTRAMLAIGRERTIAAAAHAADFADAAHLTRTFYQMFGIPPSVMMRGDFFEIAPPFSPA